MSVKYQKVWDTMNELETVTSKICSAREILDCAIDAHQEHNYEKVEHLLYAVDEFLQYYLQEFDDKFKNAWQATVGDLREGDTKIQSSKNQKPLNEIEKIRQEGGYDWTPEQQKEYTNAKIEANSPYNDGWIRQHYKKIVDEYDEKNPSLICDGDDLSDQCKNSWNDFWEDDGISITGNPHESPDILILENKVKDNVKKWILPVEECKDADNDEIEYFISFPDDLLEAANLKEGDQVEWIDQGDSSYLIKKVEKKTLNYQEAVDAGWEMTGDGIWIPPQDC